MGNELRLLGFLYQVVAEFDLANIHTLVSKISGDIEIRTKGPRLYCLNLNNREFGNEIEVQIKFSLPSNLLLSTFRE